MSFERTVSVPLHVASLIVDASIARFDHAIAVDIDVESEVGYGTTFAVQLPVEQGADSLVTCAGDSK